MRVGLVGLGRMGAAMAKRLRSVGDEVAGYDADPGKGGTSSLADVVAPLVILSLPDEGAVSSVLDALLPMLPAGAVVIDTSTLSPLSARDFADRAAQVGCGYLDAPVSGGPAGAAAGTLTVMLGGTTGALDRARPVLEKMASRLVHVGGPGAGQVAKLVNNLLVATHLVVAGEALRIGELAGVPADALLGVINAASGRSAVTEVNFPRWIQPGGFDSGFTAGLMRKDVRLALELAQAVGAEPATCTSAAAVWNAGLVSESDDFNRLTAALMAGARA
jgi:3-hydroxyisobutyrate dehydrogenase